MYMNHIYDTIYDISIHIMTFDLHGVSYDQRLHETHIVHLNHIWPFSLPHHI